MTQRRKKLIEVALPLAAINREAAREKSIRHGHPSTLHLWWARRPLAACRAVLFAQLVDDPSSDPQYRVGPRVDEERAAAKRAELFNLIEDLVKWENSNNPDIINAARAEIARCVASRKIEQGALKQETVICGPDEGQAHPNGPLSTAGVTAYEMMLMRCAPEVVNHFLATYAPPVLDPFAGGGSIPLEAQRLGLRAHASDLNPIAVLINKALIEIPPTFAGQPPVNPKARSEYLEYLGARASGPQEEAGETPALPGEEAALPGLWSGARGLAADVRYYGEWMRNEAEKRIGHLYPKVTITQDMIDAGRPDLEPYRGQELTVIAWLWARTVKCPNPGCQANMPLLTSFTLSKKKGKEQYLIPEIRGNALLFKVGRAIPEGRSDASKGMKRGVSGIFECIFCGTVTTRNYTATFACEHGLGAIPTAVVLEGNRERVYVPAHYCSYPTEFRDVDTGGLEAELAPNPRDLWCRNFGLLKPTDLFTPRQLTALTTFSDLVSEAREQILADTLGARASGPQGGAGETPALPGGAALDEGRTGPRAYADAVATYLGFALDKSANYWSSLCGWHSGRDIIRSTFGRQALPMVWDFAECNPFSNSTGNYLSGVRAAAESLANAPAEYDGAVRQIDATSKAAYSDEVIATDPPYYDNIGYADLSDFFYVWLRRTLKDVYPSLLSTMLTPKAQELIASQYRHEGSKEKASRFFENGLGNAIGKWRKHGQADYPTTIFYAFKQAETDTHGTASTGWETFLTGIIHNGFSITGTWPMRTELGNRMTGMGTNALASSIVLSCVPRAAEAGLATRREFLSALTRELPGALRALQAGNIAPVDLAQAAIGPGMALFSRYAKVVEADGSPMSVRVALALINQALDEMLAEHEGEFDADTRWAIAWFEQYGMEAGDFGVAETLSKAKNTSVQGLVEAGVVKSRSGVVQLLSRAELSAEWNPMTDSRLTEWEATHYLIRALDLHGERGASDMLRTLGSDLGSDLGEKARALAYRLYNICERKKWASEATAYNSLILAWPEIERLARTGGEGQAQAPLLQ